MRSGFGISCCLLAGVVLPCLPGLAQQQPAETSSRQVLVSFSNKFDMASIKNNGGKAQLGSPDPSVLRITTPAKAFWPGITIKSPQGKWDLSSYEYISVDIHNIDTHDIDVFIRVDNPGANGLVNCISERTAAQPDQRVTLIVPLKRVSHSPIKLFGMQGYPQGLFPDKVGLDVSNIVAITIYTPGTPTDNNFEVSNIYAAGQYQTPAWLSMNEKQFFPFVDQYGQFIHKEWPGKVHEDADLQKARATEAKALAADPAPAAWDKWGGWAKGPLLQATGHFRVEKYEGKWSLVDPDGRLFFSTGLCGVGMGTAATPIDERSNWFAQLPPRDQTGKFFYGKSWKSWSGYYKGKEPETVDFSRWNLVRKYGADWKTIYPELVHQRLRAWGINTLGNWSDGNISKQHQTPYTMTFFYQSRKLKNNSGGFPDVFAPEFPGAVLKGARQWLTSSADDPWCIGYFLDNEMPWGGETTLGTDTLVSPAEQPAKQELIRWLQKRYPTIEQLNQAWGCTFASWEAFAANTKAPAKNAASTTDLTAFTDLTAETYFRTVHDVIKQVAPHKLYLGCRCVGGSNNVIAAAIKYCDVVSYNRYCHSVRELKFPGGFDGPMMLGEFHFGALDRGLFSTGLVSTDNQQDRGRKYAGYIQSALDNPQIVGAHWFQYGDQPVTGRIDGENAQCGFVDICDTPYAETIRSARETADSMYTRRYGKP